MQKIFLDNLPKYKNGTHKGNFNWKESIGKFVKFQYEDIEGEVEIIDYKCPNLYIKYLDKEPYKINIGSFKECKLGCLLGKITNEFKVEIGKRFVNKKRDITIIDRKYVKEEYTDKQGRKSIPNKKIYQYKCNKCGYDKGWITEPSLLTLKTNCACCGTNTKITVEGINDIPTTAPEIVKFFQGGYDEAKLYTKLSAKKVIPICPDCGRVKDKPISVSQIYRKHSIGCSCGDGKPYTEKFMVNVLEQLKIDFETELAKNTFEWCNDYRYDFYFKLNNEDYIIETHGKQHYEKIGNKSKFTKSLEDEQKNDRIKKELALQNGIKEENYIIIDCRKSELEFIKNNILNSDLPRLLNFKELDIDWLKCEEYACNSLVKIVCDYKRNNPDITTLDIAKLTKLGKSAIQKCLKQGTKLGWCNYDPKEELLKSRHKGKPVEIFKNNTSLRTFENSADLERQSEKLFGVKLNKSNISNVCLGKFKQYKGFTFKYI